MLVIEAVSTKLPVILCRSKPEQQGVPNCVVMCMRMLFLSYQTKIFQRTLPQVLRPMKGSE